jgi:DnaJ-domain-containing protein 1
MLVEVDGRASGIVCVGELMSTQLIRRSRKEDELTAFRAELSFLREELAGRELALTTLLADLAAFQGSYLREVGVLYAELDEWNARISRLLARGQHDPQARSEAAWARVQTEQAAHAVRAETVPQRGFKPSLKLKHLYREVARKVHPDLATDNADRLLRERLMAQANAAYQLGNVEALKRILDEYERSENGDTCRDIGAELERLIRQIKQVRSRLSQIDQQISALKDSDLAKLRNKAEEARAEGRDLLAEMALNLRKRITAATLRFQALAISHEACK